MPKPKPLYANVEVTDTFGGEANYSWVRRYSFPCDNLTDRGIRRKAKKVAGYTGVRGRFEDMGTWLSYSPYHRQHIMFITFAETPHA